MTDDPKKRNNPDDKRISSQDHERVYWAEKFGVTRAKLDEAIRAVGTSATAVEKWLMANG